MISGRAPAHGEMPEYDALLDVHYAQQRVAALRA